MESVDKLRDYVERTCGCNSGRHDIQAIADEIEREYEADVSTACRLAAGLDNDELAKRGYIALPKDADGVPIHYGDKVYITTTVVCTVTQLRYVNGNWQVGCTCENCMNYYSPQSIRHVKSDSWEQIIMDALKEGYDRKEFFLMSESRVSTADLVARCKALAGEE